MDTREYRFVCSGAKTTLDPVKGEAAEIAKHFYGIAALSLHMSAKSFALCDCRSCQRISADLGRALATLSENYEISEDGKGRLQ